LERFPNYDRWLALLAHRNDGVLAVVFLAVATLLVLLEVRWLWPRLYPALRNTGFVLYLVLFGLSLLAGGLSR
jgi:hypothetical protein